MKVFLLNNLRLNSEIAEIIGAHIGDGSMGKYKNGYIISFCGHPIEEKYYVKWVAQIYLKYFGVNPRIRKWSRILGFQIFSKEIFDFFLSLGIPSGRKNNIDIPISIKNSNKKVIASFLRGIFDTDGTIYFEKRKKLYYPRIQLKITENKLANSINTILKNKFGINSTLYSRKERINWKMSHFVEIRGKENLDKWLGEIGFRNIKNMSKVILWKKNINPQQPFDIRIKLLGGLGSTGPVSTLCQEAQHGRAADRGLKLLSSEKKL